MFNNFLSSKKLISLSILCKTRNRSFLLNGRYLGLFYIQCKYISSLSDQRNTLVSNAEHFALEKDASIIKALPQLFKAKLSALVLCTTITGFLMVPNILLFSIPTLKLLLHTFIGTGLCSFSANGFNQWIEASFDGQMARTKLRPLPSRKISLPSAFFISSFIGLFGVSYLFFFISPLSSLIALSTILLYSGIYTPLKRRSIYNTWVGAIVGALPPLIGWTAGLQCVPNLEAIPSFGWVPIFFLLYFWQFPHFFSLSWNLQRDYARAGYRMCSLLKPDLAVSSSLKNSAAIFPLTWLFYLTGITNFYFPIIGSFINLILFIPALKFKFHPERKSARRLFFASLVHLPLMLCSLLILKK